MAADQPQPAVDSTEVAAATESDLGQDLSDLWDAEMCDWHVEHRVGDGPWVVLLEWTQEYGNAHQADWITYNWQFYGDTVDEAMAEAVEWCWGLVPWKPCDECDGRGSWNGTLCGHCKGRGLANPEPIDVEVRS